MYLNDRVLIYFAILAHDPILGREGRVAGNAERLLVTACADLVAVLILQLRSTVGALALANLFVDHGRD